MSDDLPSFDQKPFVRKHLNTKDDIVPVRFNDQERAMLREVMQVFRCDADATTIKRCLEFVHGELQNPARKAFYLWLSESRRMRPGPK